jgi:hypothetical protein
MNFSHCLASSPTLVSCQTAFWIIVALALSVMAQPCGRVLGFTSRYKTYFRSSPVICAVDTVMIIIRVIILCIKLRISPRTAIVLLVEKRFKDARPAEDSRAMVYFTWMRWVYFVLGPLPMSVKLASFQGTPVTQTIGFTFLISFVLIEFLNVMYGMARSLEEVHLEEGRVAPHRSNVDPELYKSVDEAITKVERLFGWFLFYALMAANYAFLQYWLIWTLPYYGFLLGIYCLHVFPTGYYYFTILAYLCEKYPVIGENLLLRAHHSEGQGRSEFDKTAAGMMYFFLLNLVTCVRGYTYAYDPSGTVNPGWTTIFG